MRRAFVQEHAEYLITNSNQQSVKLFDALADSYNTQLDTIIQNKDLALMKKYFNKADKLIRGIESLA